MIHQKVRELATNMARRDLCYRYSQSTPGLFVPEYEVKVHYDMLMEVVSVMRSHRCNEVTIEFYDMRITVSLTELGS